MNSRTRKRANGEGSIRKVGNKYKGSVTMGHDSSGRQVRRYFTANSHAEAQERLASGRLARGLDERAQSSALLRPETRDGFVARRERGDDEEPRAHGTASSQASPSA